MKRLPLIFGLSSLFLAPAWVMLFYRFGTPAEGIFVANHYHYGAPYILHTVAGLFDWLVAIAVLGLIAAFSERFSPRARIAGTIFAFVTLYMLYASIAGAVFFRGLTKYHFLPAQVSEELVVFAVLGLTSIIGIWLLVRFSQSLPAALARLSKHLGLPIGAVLLVNAFWAGGLMSFPVQIEYPLAQPAAGKLVQGVEPKVRVVWMIFDGWDHRLTFDDRSTDLNMPVTDRLVGQAFWAKNAVTPTNGTVTSTTGMMTGKAVTPGIEIRHKDDFGFAVDGRDETFLLSRTETIFSDVREGGKNAVILTHDLQAHPYCRILGRDLSACWEERWWTGKPMSAVGQMDDFLYSVVDQVTRYFDRTTIDAVPDALPKYQEFKHQVIQAGCQADNDLVYAHWMLPHAPFFYDHKADRFSAGVWGPYETLYDDNLALTDRTIGDVLSAYRDCGATDNTVFILTADHGYAGNSHPVFMALFPDRAEQVIYEKPAKLVNLRTAINAILDGSVTSGEDLRRLFDRVQ